MEVILRFSIRFRLRWLVRAVQWFAVFSHAIRRAHFEDRAAVLLHQPAKVAVGQDPREASIGFQDGGHAEFLADISWKTSGIGVSFETRGSASPRA